MSSGLLHHLHMVPSSRKCDVDSGKYLGRLGNETWAGISFDDPPRPPLPELAPHSSCLEVHYAHVCAGDVNEIRIGENSNIQDGVIIHVAKNNAAGTSLPTIIGSNVTIGDPGSCIGTTCHVLKTCESLVACLLTSNTFLVSLEGLGRIRGCLAGHGATVHAATIEDGALVGMGATVLDGSKASKLLRIN